MKNPYLLQILPNKEVIKKQLPYGLETTADLMLGIVTLQIVA